MLENCRTDLALELIDEDEAEVLDGVRLSKKSYDDGRIELSIIRITNKRAEARLGKPKGCYITIEGKTLGESDESIHESFVDVLNNQLKKLVKGADKILVIGLGNREVTPDALGPFVVDNLCITRHLLREGIIENRLELSAISPGVMAQTGIESLTILKALCNEVKPDIVFAIDSLAAEEVSRLNTTIQICDTGINPGAGVGNHRLRLSEETLGIKVIAIGVPTVISMNSILNSFQDEKRREELSDMFVTPKNIDEAVKKISYTISEAINALVYEHL
jgi:spore protease